MPSTRDAVFQLQTLTVRRIVHSILVTPYSNSCPSPLSSPYADVKTSAPYARACRATTSASIWTLPFSASTSPACFRAFSSRLPILPHRSLFVFFSCATCPFRSCTDCSSFTGGVGAAAEVTVALDFSFERSSHTLSAGDGTAGAAAVLGLLRACVVAC